MLMLFVAGAVTYVLWHNYKANQAAHDEAMRRPTMDSMSYTYTSDGDMIKTYVVTDPDTGIQYVVTDHGGITPRLGRDGSVMGVVDAL